MIGALMTYGALNTKVKALYGKRLRIADYEHMGALRREVDVLDYLRQQVGWKDALAQLGGYGNTFVGRIELESALRDQIRADYLSLRHFVPKGDKHLMDFLVRLAEQDAILKELHRLKAGRYYKGHPTRSHFPLSHQVDAKALSQCTSYEELVQLCAKSIYGPALRHLMPEDGGLPDFTVTEGLLRSAYFSYMYRIIYREYNGKTQELLLKSYGEQVDLLNIIHVLRLKTYAPKSPSEIYMSVLFPFHYRIKTTTLLQMCEAPDVASAFALLGDTHYKDCLADGTVGSVEAYYRRNAYRFHRRQLVTGEPSIFTALSYLSVKDCELQALINVVESVKYGVPYDADFARLVGT